MLSVSMHFCIAGTALPISHFSRYSSAMKQTFNIRGGAALGRENLPKLREKLASTGLDFLYVPHEDEYNNEYLPDAYERLAWAVSYTHLTLPTIYSV